MNLIDKLLFKNILIIYLIFDININWKSWNHIKSIQKYLFYLGFICGIYIGGGGIILFNPTGGGGGILFILFSGGGGILFNLFGGGIIPLCTFGGGGITLCGIICGGYILCLGGISRSILSLGCTYYISICDSKYSFGISSVSYISLLSINY